MIHCSRIPFSYFPAYRYSPYLFICIYIRFYVLVLKIIFLTHPYTPIISSAVPALISDNFLPAFQVPFLLIIHMYPLSCSGFLYALLLKAIHMVIRQAPHILSISYRLLDLCVSSSNHLLNSPLFMSSLQILSDSFLFLLIIQKFITYGFHFQPSAYCFCISHYFRCILTFICLVCNSSHIRISSFIKI